MLRRVAAILGAIVCVVGCGRDARVKRERYEPRIQLTAWRKGEGLPAGGPVVPCEELVQEDVRDGRVRVRFARLSPGLTSLECEPLGLESDLGLFLGLVQKELRRQPECRGCELITLEQVDLRDAELDVLVRDRSGDPSARLIGFIDPRAPVERTGEMTLAWASFTFRRKASGWTHGELRSSCTDRAEGGDDCHLSLVEAPR